MILCGVDAAPLLAVGTVYLRHDLGGYEIIWQAPPASFARRRSAWGADDRPSLARAAPPRCRIPTSSAVSSGTGATTSGGAGPGLSLSPGAADAAGFYRHATSSNPTCSPGWPVGGLSLGLIERARWARIRAVLSSSIHGRSTLRAMTGDSTVAAEANGHRQIERLTGLPTRVDGVGAGRWAFCSQAMRAQTLAALPNPTDGR